MVKKSKDAHKNSETLSLEDRRVDYINTNK